MQRPTREEIEEQFVQVAWPDTVAEADAIAKRLRELDIIALANAEVTRFWSQRNFRRKAYRAFVLVHESDYDRAIEHLEGPFRPEGDVPPSVIVADFERAALAPETATAWYEEDRLERRRRKRLVAIPIRLLVGGGCLWFLWNVVF